MDWDNHPRLFEARGGIPLAELETAAYRQNAGLTEASEQQTESPDSPGDSRIIGLAALTAPGKGRAAPARTGLAEAAACAGGPLAGGLPGPGGN